MFCICRKKLSLLSLLMWSDVIAWLISGIRKLQVMLRLISGLLNPLSSGYFLTDYDECADMSSNNCDRYATCHNTPTGYYCLCTEGYSGDGISCTGNTASHMHTSNKLLQPLKCARYRKCNSRSEWKQTFIIEN